MAFETFIQGLFARRGRHWRSRALLARAAFEQDPTKRVAANTASVLPSTTIRRRLFTLQRGLTHLCLVVITLGVVVSDQLIQRSTPALPAPVTMAPQVLDQQLPLAIAPLPLDALVDTQRTPALSPIVSEPLLVPTVFQTQHILVSGETLGTIAERYAISLEALIWANRLERGDALVEGQVLQIPRTSGVLHQINQGETLATIAALYKVSPEVIFGFAPNRLDSNALATLPVGAEIFVPSGVRALPESLLSAYGGLEGLAMRGPVLAGIVLADETNVRDGPTTEHQRLFQLEAGRQVALLARYMDWIYVKLGAQQGWLRSDLIAIDPVRLAELPEKTDFPEPPPRWVWPARGSITSRFGPRWGGFHNGLDIANRAWTPIIAARSGVVREAGWCSGYGYCVKIRHPGGVETIYGHLIAQPVVAAGESVAAGQLIGHMGSTYDRAGGGYSTGVHLHFTVLIGGRAVDPLRVLP